MRKRYSAYKSLRFILTSVIFAIMLSAGTIATISVVILREIGMIRPLQPIKLVITAFVFSLILGTFISLVVSYFYVKPTKALIAATKEISKGNFDVKVEVNEESGTEFSELQRSFNKMAEELSSIEMFKNGFINDFSHEFKTPIVSIKGFANQLKNEKLTPEQRAEYIDIIIAESDRLAKMSTNVLLLSKLENQQIISNRTNFLLDEQLRQSILLLEKQWESKNIDLDIDFEPISVNANAEMTSHIWINLISNAIKFSSENGIVSLSCKNIDGKASVCIRDHGCGMTQDEITHIFDKFYQADSSRKAEGNGLGLSIVGRIVSLYDGRIDVKSTPGKGSEFTVTLDILNSDGGSSALNNKML